MCNIKILMDNNNRSGGEGQSSKVFCMDTDAEIETSDTAQQENTMEASLDQTETSHSKLIEEPESELLKALGIPIVYEKILQTYLNVVLCKGITEDKDILIEENTKNITENWEFLRAPALDDEISASICEDLKRYDEKLKSNQNQLGIGIAAIINGLTGLMQSDDDVKKDKFQVIKSLADGCKILCDLHYIGTQARQKIIIPNLPEKFLPFAQEVYRNESLFGNISLNKTGIKPQTQNVQASSSKSKPAKRTQKHKDRSTQNKQMPTETYPGVNKVLQYALTKTGSPKESMNIMISSYAKSTIARYNKSYKLWWEFCRNNELNPHKGAVPDILRFLLERFDIGDSDIALMQHRAALSLLIGRKISHNIDTKRFMKGVSMIRKKESSMNVDNNNDDDANIDSDTSEVSK